MKELIKKIRLETVMWLLVTVSAIVIDITMIMINAFGVVALTNVMSAAAFVFIFSGSYLLGHYHGYREAVWDYRGWNNVKYVPYQGEAEDLTSEDEAE